MPLDNQRIHDEIAKLSGKIDCLLEQSVGDAVRVKIPEANSGYYGFTATDTGLGHWSLVAREILQQKLRTRYLNVVAQDQGAWIILLYIGKCQIEGRPASTNDAIIASCKPATTALRCVEALIRTGLVAPSPNWTDEQKTGLVLTEKARNKLDSYFEALEKDETSLALDSASRVHQDE